MKKKFNFFVLRLWNIFTHTNLYLNLQFNKKRIKKLKIIFIKPYNFLDIYNKNINSKIADTLRSNYRMGPVGLFINHNTDFVISSSYDDKEIDSDYELKKLDKVNSKALLKQKKIAKNIRKINFNNYDLAIFFESTVPERITKKFNKVLWFKIYEDHKKKSFLSNLILKPKFFDGILNQTLGFTPYSFLKRLHSIDFSFTYGNSDFLKRIKNKRKKDIEIIVEVNQHKSIQTFLLEYNKKKKIKYYNKIHLLDENLNHKDYISKLARGRFFFATNPKTPRWGNSLIEAAICQNLIIGDRNSFWNSQIIIKELHCKNVSEALNLVKFLKKNKNIYNQYLRKQNQLLNYLNYIRPIEQIFDYSRNCSRDLNIHKKI